MCYWKPYTVTKMKIGCKSSAEGFWEKISLSMLSWNCLVSQGSCCAVEGHSKEVDSTPWMILSKKPSSSSAHQSCCYNMIWGHKGVVMCLMNWADHEWTFVVDCFIYKQTTKTICCVSYSQCNLFRNNGVRWSNFLRQKITLGVALRTDCRRLSSAFDTQ